MEIPGKTEFENNYPSPVTRKYETNCKNCGKVIKYDVFIYKGDFTQKQIQDLNKFQLVPCSCGETTELPYSMTD